MRNGDTRNKSGIRNYDEESCRWIELMKCMRSAGVQIEALIEYVALFQQGDSTIDARKALLMEQRDQLNADLCEEISGTCGISFDLSADIGHIDPQGLRITF